MQNKDIQLIMQIECNRFLGIQSVSVIYKYLAEDMIELFTSKSVVSVVTPGSS